MLLAEQNRARWDADLVAEGQAIVRRCLRRDRPGPYQIQAAINAVHSDAATAADTDWHQIVALYDQLLARTPTPVVALHRAVAVAEVDGPTAGLALVDRLAAAPATPRPAPSDRGSRRDVQAGVALDRHHLLHAVRAELLRRSGRFGEAAQAYGAAIELAGNLAEREFLRRRRAMLYGS